MSQEIIVTIQVFGFQNYVNYERKNPIEITVKRCHRKIIEL